VNYTIIRSHFFHLTNKSHCDRIYIEKSCCVTATLKNSLNGELPRQYFLGEDGVVLCPFGRTSYLPRKRAIIATSNNPKVNKHVSASQVTIISPPKRAPSTAIHCEKQYATTLFCILP
jgi:hypothetical protein